MLILISSSSYWLYRALNTNKIKDNKNPKSFFESLTLDKQNTQKKITTQNITKKGKTKSNNKLEKQRRKYVLKILAEQNRINEKTKRQAEIDAQQRLATLKAKQDVLNRQAALLKQQQTTIHRITRAS